MVDNKWPMFESILIPYSYTVIQYRPDITTGECLNIGIVLHCSEAKFLKTKWVDNTSRLENAFKHFDISSFNITKKDFIKAINSWECKNDNLTDSTKIVQTIWPDNGLSYCGTPARFGINCSNLNNELEILFELFITSQSKG